MKSKQKPAPKPLSPAGEKLLEMLREIYAPIEWPSDEAVEREKARKNSESAKIQHSGSDKKLSHPVANHHETATAHKAAELFNTNRTPP